MNIVFAALVVVILSIVFIFSYYLNSRVSTDCRIEENNCEGCKLETCYLKVDKEE